MPATDPLNAEIELREAAQRINRVITGLERVFDGGPTETVNNGSKDLPTIDKLLTDANERLQLAIDPVLQAAATLRDAAAASAEQAADSAAAALAAFEKGNYLIYNDRTTANDAIGVDLAEDDYALVLQDETNQNLRTLRQVQSGVLEVVFEPDRAENILTASGATQAVRNLTLPLRFATKVLADAALSGGDIPLGQDVLIDQDDTLGGGGGRYRNTGGASLVLQTYSAALSRLPPGGTVADAIKTVSTEMFGGVQETLDAAATHSAKVVYITLPATTIQKYTLAGLSGADVYITGDITATAVVGALFEVAGCSKIKIWCDGEWNGGNLAEIGIDVVNCDQVLVLDLDTKALRSPAGAAIGVRFNGSRHCWAIRPKISDVAGLVARGVYAGTVASPSYGCGIKDYEISNVMGASLDGDAIHVQQDEDAGFIAWDGDIGDFNWRAVKVQAPGVIVDTLRVSDSAEANKNSVISAFYGDFVCRGVRGSATRVTHGIEQQAHPAEGQINSGVVYSDIHLSLTGDNTNQALQYLYREFGGLGSIEGTELRNVNINGDSNYNRGLTLVLSDRAKIRGGSFTGPAAESVLQTDCYDSMGATYGYFVTRVSGTGGRFIGNCVRNYFYVDGAECTVLANENDTMELGDSRFNVRSTALNNLIGFNKIRNVDSESATPISIFITAGASGNRLIDNFYNTVGSTSEKPVRLLDSTPGANAIIDRGTLVETEHTATTDAAANTVIWSRELPDNSSCLITVNLIGQKIDATERRSVVNRSLFYRNGGGAALQGAQSVAHDQASGGFSGNYSVGNSGNVVQLRVNSGGTGTYYWRARVTVDAV